MPLTVYVRLMDAMLYMSREHLQNHHHHNNPLFLPEMYAQASVLARALQTNPDPIGHTNPLRVKSPTLKT